MAPIKLAVVADALLVEMGGVPRSIIGITRELAALDPERIEVTVVAARRPDSVNGLAFRRSRAPRVPRLPNAMFAVQRPFVLRDYDVVHYMDSRPPVTFPLGARLNAVTQHGFAPLMFSADYVSRRDRVVNEVLIRLAASATLTFTASESERDELLARVPLDPESVVAVHHGVDHDRFFPAADPGATSAAVKARLGVSGRYVLYVSNHQRKKNTEGLVEAFAEIARDDPTTSLVLTGRGGRSFHLVEELIQRHGLEERVRVLGHVPDEDLPDLYRAAAAFALPSLHEGFGIPVLEAMACGTPVLAASVYALPEVCGNAAELVDPYRPAAIAEGLRRILDDAGRAEELRTAGLERAAQFTWRRSAEKHLAAYEAALTRLAVRKGGRRLAA
ncbi:MAG TPA: glycosyltransferase family 1 protein [Gaiellaceae bacterium]|nr:glycosyltransferase family 1 protein [Gaiellaceae bacterium]